MAGFVPGSGTDFTSGTEREIASRLDTLAKRLGVTIFGISGARTPAHSVAVGGFANDPHTRGQAADIGVGSMLRSSAAQLTDAQLASVGLYRPFAGATEINHVQLKPGSSSSSSGVKDAIKGALGGATGAGGAIAGAAGGVLPDIPGPGDIASSIVNKLWGAVKDDAAKGMLYVLLVGGGVYLAVTGASRAVGMKPNTAGAAAVPQRAAAGVLRANPELGAAAKIATKAGASKL